MEDVNKNESWNKKRILIAVLLLLLLIIGGYFFKTRVLGTGESPFAKESKSVKGASNTEDKTAKEDLSTNIKESVREKLNALKQEVSGLDILEIASSSPQVQKVLNDIKSLEQYPTNQAKEICRQICGL